MSNFRWRIVHAVWDTNYNSRGINLLRILRVFAGKDAVLVQYGTEFRFYLTILVSLCCASQPIRIARWFGYASSVTDGQHQPYGRAQRNAVAG
jgi:hypothetical protein